MDRRQRKPTRRVRRQNAPVPAAAGVSVSARQPSIRSGRSPDSRVFVTHRELIASIATNTAFNTALKSFDINPGLGATFPWLQTLAKAYENYEFTAMRFIYEPTVGTTTNGCVYMAVDYDANDDNPVDEKSLSSYHGAVVSPLYQNATFICDKVSLSRFKGQRYVRYEAMVESDIKTYDLGTLFISAVAASVFTCGNLFVEYSVTLMTPSLPDWLEAADLSAKIAGSPTDRQKPFANTTITGNVDTVSVGDDGYGGQSNTLFFKRAGQWLLELFGSGTTASDTSPVTVIRNTQNHDENAVLTKILGQEHNTAGTNWVDTYIFKNFLPDTGITFDFTSSMAALNGIQARISPYTYSVA